MLNGLTSPPAQVSTMNTDNRTFVFMALIVGLLAITALPEAGGQSPPPQAQAVGQQDQEETEEEKEKKKKKKQQEEQQKKQQEKKQQQQQEKQQAPPADRPPADRPPADRPPPPPDQRQPSEAEKKRQVDQQKQQDREIRARREQQERQLKQRRVTQQEQQERIQRQQQQLALYKQKLATQEQLAEKDRQILRQQNRIRQWQLQEQYEDRLRAQRARLTQTRYDYNNDPYYYTAPNYRYVRDGRYYQTNQYGIRQLERALQAGYNEGFKAGRADREDRWRYDPRSAFGYRDANYGYDGRYVAQDEYNHYFRQGFERGYEDGYYGRNKYGRKNDGDGNIIEGVNDEWLIAGAVVAAIIGYQVLTD